MGMYKKKNLVVNRTTMKPIYDAIDKTTIPNEMKVMYLIASACQTIVEDVHNRVKGVFADFGIVAGENELLKGVNDYCKAVKAAEYHFYNRVNPKIVDATWGIGREIGEDGKIELYDQFNDDAYELVRLMLLYIDRAAQNNDAFAKVFTLLRKMPSQNLFDNKDIARFKQK